jgi:AbrB family looped-hinge helix DNA binding protein
LISGLLEQEIVMQSARIVQLPARGQITLPTDFRRKLGMKEGSLIEMRLAGDRIEIRPARTDPDILREYTEAEIQQFLEEDRIDDDTAQAVRRLLATGKL